MGPIGPLAKRNGPFIQPRGTDAPGRRMVLGIMPRRAPSPFALAALLALAAVGRLHCLELAWLRVLCGEEAVTWRRLSAPPARPEGFPLDPAAVLSYTDLSPGDSLSEAELEARAATWDRALAESRRFSRSSVLVVEVGEEGSRRGLIAEVETGAVPIFGGGNAYAAATLPLVGGRRASLALEAGADRATVAYRDFGAWGLPLVLEAGLGYRNDLPTEGRFVGHRLAPAFGLGPRLGRFGALLLRARAELALGGGAPYSALAAALELRGLDLVGVERFDGSLSLSVDSYPGSSALRYSAEARLELARGAATIALEAGAGLSSGPLDSRELFDLAAGSLAYLRGPEAGTEGLHSFALGRLELDLAAYRRRAATWLELAIGPFAFAELALAPLVGDSPGGAIALGGSGGGLRLRLGPPVGIIADLGYAFGSRASRGLVLSIISKRPLE
jgi:hypothetical protein